MVLILWDGVPLFRKLVQLQQTATGTDEIIWLIAIICIQFPYWKCLRHDPPFGVPRQQFVGHVILFVSRLSFIFASAVFSFAIYRHPDIFELAFIRSSLVMAVLFSVFCFSRYLDKMGRLFQTGYAVQTR